MANKNQQEWFKQFNDQASKGWVEELKKGQPDLAEIFPDDLDPKSVYAPERADVFKAFATLGPDEVKYIVIGKDPYSYKSGAATGIAFLVREGAPPQPSLKNLMGKLFPADKEPDVLAEWSRKKYMLLLNAALTIPQDGSSGSHLSDWSNFISAVIRCLKDIDKTRVCAVGRAAERVLRMALKEAGRDVVLGECYYVHPSPRHLNKSRFRETWCTWRRENEGLYKE